MIRFLAPFQSGMIAHELEYVQHHVRTKLDELKRQEMNRLVELVNKQVCDSFRLFCRLS